ncbi:MAG TPA: M64 family metallopeptidase, partial [Planctomycetota bacterium]|nr:M64 family metallopeptidase [Planctomycetota bacterium]
LTKAGRFAEAKAAIQAQLDDPTVKASAIASDLGKSELEAIARKERLAKPATPTEPDDTDTPSTEPSTPTAPTPKRKKPPEPGSPASKADAPARALYLDSLGARVAPETRVLTAEGKRTRVLKVSQAGVDVEGATLAWASLPPASLVELVSALEGKGGPDACEGAALVLYDMGLWQKADARIKAWIDAQPDAKARALAIVARARGVAASDFVWKTEWLTPGEDDARVKDLVTFDGQTCTREEARRSIGKQKDDRAKVRKQKTEADAKKRAEALKRDWGVTDIRTLVNNGDPAKRCDIVVISDGFSKEGMPAFEKKADLVAAALLTVEPFCNYQKYVNVHRIEIEEPKNGLGGTRIGARANGDAITCDKDAARRYAALAPDCDLVVVVANVRNLRATGSMGRRPGVITLEMSDVVGDVVLHELGHSFAGLEDEYEDAGLVPHFPDFGDEDEWRFVNATRQSNPRLSKWHYWLLPPALPPDRTVGCVEGSYYRGSGGGYYRPSNTCRMHGENHHYCAVCLEQLEKEFYKTLEPIDDALPRTSEVAIGRDEVAHFEADTLVIEAATEKFGSFAARWFVDGKRTPAKSAGHRTQLDLSGQDATAGDHEVTLRLDLKDTRVRRDAGLLSSTRGWKLKVLDTGRCKIGAPDKVTVRRGELVSFDATLDAGPADSRVAADFPAGAFVPVGRGGHFVWAPPRDAHGAYRVVLTAGTGASRVEKPVDITISDEGREIAPIFKDPPIVHAVRGQRLELPLEAVSPSGDALVYTATKPLPLGATLDPSGVLRWTPGWAGGFTSEVEVSVRVTDGKATDDLTFRIHVESRPITKAKGGFDLLAATRSPDDDVRALALEALPASDLPLDCKLLELARLMRDRVPEISKRAIELLRAQPVKPGAEDKALHVRRNLLVLDQQDRAWEFTDRKEARALLADLAKETYEAEPKTAASHLAADLAAIDKHNKDRGAPP